jgi:copper chaperone NosL
MKKTISILFLFTSLFLSSCTGGFEPIVYGHEACSYCKMTIMDKRYAAEVLTKKGKTYKFDDISCLKKYIAEEKLPESAIAVFVADYKNPGSQFLDAREVVYLHNEIFKSPMNGNFAAFSKAENARPLEDSLHTGLLKWGNLN